MKISRVLTVGTLIRICFHLSLHIIFPEVKQCHGLKAVLIDPWYSLTQLKETSYLSRLYVEGHLNINSQGQLEAVPVFLFSFFDKTILHKDHELLELIGFTLVTILIDLLVALQIFRWTKNVIESKTLEKNWEVELEKHMNPRIHPNFAHMFGLKFGTQFITQQNDVNDSSNPNGDSRGEEKSNLEVTAKNTFMRLPDIPSTCCILYFLNPISILASSTEPTFQGLQYLLLLSAFEQITKKSNEEDRVKIIRQWNVFLATFSLALLTYIDIYYIIFLSPMIWYVKQNQRLRARQQIGSKFFILMIHHVLLQKKLMISHCLQ